MFAASQAAATFAGGSNGFWAYMDSGGSLTTKNVGTMGRYPKKHAAWTAEKTWKTNTGSIQLLTLVQWLHRPLAAGLSPRNKRCPTSSCGETREVQLLVLTIHSTFGVFPSVFHGLSVDLLGPSGLAVWVVLQLLHIHGVLRQILLFVQRHHLKRRSGMNGNGSEIGAPTKCPEKHMEVSWNWGTPSHHPYLTIFSMKYTINFGVPPV